MKLTEAIQRMQARRRPDDDPPLPPWATSYLAAFDRHLRGDEAARGEMTAILGEHGIEGRGPQRRAGRRAGQRAGE